MRVGQDLHTKVKKEEEKVVGGAVYALERHKIQSV